MKKSPFAALLGAFAAIAVVACGGSSAEPSPETEDALALGGPAHYYLALPSAGGPTCLQTLNASSAPSCMGSVGLQFETNPDESFAIRDAMAQGRVVTKASFIVVQGAMMGGAGYEATEAWLASAPAGGGSDPWFLVSASGPNKIAQKLNASGKASIGALDLSASGVSPADVDAALAAKRSVVVRGNVAGTTLTASQVFMPFKHVVTMLDGWNYDEKPGDHLAGARYSLTPGAQLSFTLVTHGDPGSPKKEGLRIDHFEVTPPGVLRLDDKKIAIPNSTSFDRDVRIAAPEGAAPGSFVVKAIPAAGYAGDPGYDFSFTVSIGAKCEAKLVVPVSPGVQPQCK